MENPTIGDPLRDIQPRDILRANRIMAAASVVGLALGLGARWVVLLLL